VDFRLEPKLVIEMRADRVAIAIAKLRSTNIEFFLFRFGDAVVQPLCIKCIKSITPRFAFGLLGAVFM
jgi:hypothetical protein